MKLNAWLMTVLTSLSVMACSSNPPLDVPEFGVLEEVQNINVYPSTNENAAQLVKLSDYCIIEFAGSLESGLANEKWQFKGNALMAASSTMIAEDGSSTGESFDLYDKQVQQNFLALKSHFKKQHMQRCD